MDENLEVGRMKTAKEALLLSVPNDKAIIMKDFNRIYLQWSQPIYRYTLSRIQNQAEAEDITSQVFVTVFEKLNLYKEEGRFIGWLFRITKNKIADYYRKNKTPQLALTEIEKLNHTEVLNQDQYIDLVNLINRLPQFDQDLLRLRYSAVLTFQEVGLFLGKKEDAIRKAHSRILKRLKIQMENEHEN